MEKAVINYFVASMQDYAVFVNGKFVGRQPKSQDTKITIFKTVYVATLILMQPARLEADLSMQMRYLRRVSTKTRNDKNINETF